MWLSSGDSASTCPLVRFNSSLAGRAAIFMQHTSNRIRRLVISIEPTVAASYDADDM